MSADTLPATPDIIPQHEVRNSLAYYNRLRGFYANHHLGGIIFESNTAVNSGENYNMTNRELPLALPPTDVSGYDYNRQIKKFPTEKQNVSLKHILT